jgi:hypothetical protein
MFIPVHARESLAGWTPAQQLHLPPSGDLLALGVDGDSFYGVLEEEVAAVLEDGAGGVVKLVGVRCRLKHLHRPPRLSDAWSRLLINTLQ